MILYFNWLEQSHNALACVPVGRKALDCNSEITSSQPHDGAPQMPAPMNLAPDVLSGDAETDAGIRYVRGLCLQIMKPRHKGLPSSLHRDPLTL